MGRGKADSLDRETVSAPAASTNEFPCGQSPERNGNRLPYAVETVCELSHSRRRCKYHCARPGTVSSTHLT
jgi:hypothetical protein